LEHRIAFRIVCVDSFFLRFIPGVIKSLSSEPLAAVDDADEEASNTFSSSFLQDAALLLLIMLLLYRHRKR